MKKIAIGLVALLVVVAAGGYALWSNLDHIILVNIEKYGSLATKTDVKLDHVKLALTSGQGELDGLSVSNPQGFSSSKALYLGSIALTLDANSVRGDGPIIIHEVTIEQPQVRYELLNNGDSNLQTIQKNTQDYANSFSGAAPENKPAGTDKPARKVIIEHLSIKNGQVAISQAMLKDRQLAVPLPDINLHNIGKETGGATVAQVADQILGSISSAASQSAVAELAKAKIGGLLKEVPGSAIGGAAVDTIGTQVKGLFGK